MVLMTKNRTLLRLVRNAYDHAQVRGDQVLVVWNARIYLDDSLIVMESSCPIFLDKIVEQLRLFTGDKPQVPGRFIWVRAAGNPARRWRTARQHHLPVPAVQADASEGR